MSTPALPIQETPPADIVAELDPALPTPPAPATPAPQAPVTPATPPADAPKDVNGVSFDPTKHATNADGTPRRDKLGRFFSNRFGGSKAKAPVATLEVKPVSFIPEATPTGQSTPPVTPKTEAVKVPEGQGSDRFTLLADVCARAALSGLMAALGDEWAPDDDAEYIGLRDSVAAYLRATNREDLSPGWALAFAGVTYAGKRLPRPKTQTRIAFFMDKVRAWWRGRSVARTVASYPQPNA